MIQEINNTGPQEAPSPGDSGAKEKAPQVEHEKTTQQSSCRVRVVREKYGMLRLDGISGPGDAEWDRVAPYLYHLSKKLMREVGLYGLPEGWYLSTPSCAWYDYSNRVSIPPEVAVIESILETPPEECLKIRDPKARGLDPDESTSSIFDELMDEADDVTRTSWFEDYDEWDEDEDEDEEESLDPDQKALNKMRMAEELEKYDAYRDAGCRVYVEWLAENLTGYTRIDAKPPYELDLCDVNYFRDPFEIKVEYRLHWRDYQCDTSSGLITVRLLERTYWLGEYYFSDIEWYAPDEVARDLSKSL